MASSNRNRNQNSKALANTFVRFEAAAVPLVPKGADIQECQPRALGKDNRQTYQEIKSQFKQDLSVRDSRFYLSDMVANQLSVEEEEKRRFEKRVEEETARRLAVLKTEAYNTAREEGLREGQEKAYSEEKARIAKELELFADCFNTMEAAKENLAKQYESSLTELAFRVAEVVVHHEIKERPELIHHTITEILERIAREDDVRIRLSSSDFDIISKIKSEVQKVARGGRITFEIDTSLKSGDCIVESLSGEIASYVTEKMNILREKIVSQVSVSETETAKVG